MKKTLFAITSVILITALPLSSPGTGIPVIDVSNLGESIKHGLEQIRQFALQVQQFETELNLYKNAVLQATGIAEAAQIWSDVQRTYGQVIGTVNGLQSYVTQSRDINYWISSAQSAGSAQYSQSAGYWSTAQKSANNALVSTIQKQQAQLTADAAMLSRLQSQGGSTVGMKQSLDVANSMSSLMASQLMAIRTLMMSEQQAVAARNGALSNNEAIGSANSQSLLNVNPSYSQPHTGWSPIQ
jgi:P-type conjugative transfer protein TrbJ